MHSRYHRRHRPHHHQSPQSDLSTPRASYQMTHYLPQQDILWVSYQPKLSDPSINVINKSHGIYGVVQRISRIIQSISDMCPPRDQVPKQFCQVTIQFQTFLCVTHMKCLCPTEHDTLICRCVGEKMNTIFVDIFKVGVREFSPVYRHGRMSSMNNKALTSQIQS